MRYPPQPQPGANPNGIVQQQFMHMLRQLQLQQLQAQPPILYRQAPPQIIHVREVSPEGEIQRGVSVAFVLVAVAIVIIALAVGIALIMAIAEGYSFYWQWGFLIPLPISLSFTKLFQ